MSDIGARPRGPGDGPKPLPITTMRPADEGPDTARIRASDAARAGYALSLLLGSVTLQTPRDFARMVLLAQHFSQISMYCASWDKPTSDKLLDLSMINEALEQIDHLAEDNAKSAVSLSAWK